MTKKQSSWVWFLLAVLPIIIIIISYTNNTNNGNIDTEYLFESIGFQADVEINYIPTGNGANYEYAKYTIYFSEPDETNSLESMLIKVYEQLMQTEWKNYFIPQYIAYLIRLYIIKIAFDVFLLLPKICNRLINKAIGSGEIE